MVAWVEPVDAETERQPSNPCRRQRWQTFEAVIILPLALMSASGPNSDLGAPEREVRFAPIDGHRQVGPAGPFRANSRHDAPSARNGDQWFGQRQAAEALSSGSLSDLAENGLVR